MTRKVLTILFLLFITQYAFSQTKHLEFCGIPLDGSIEQFTKRMKSEGFNISPLNEVCPIGTRVFEGEFARRHVMVEIHYDEKSKIVFNAQVGFQEFGVDSEKMAQQQYDYLLNLLSKKYSGSDCIEGDMYCGRKKINILTKEGQIALWIYDYGQKYHEVSLSYIDEANYIKYATRDL